jgi:hypothetical protein
MDKEDIKRAAQEAVNDLQLDCEITEITRPLGKDTWCIQFTGSFGQFCDEFHDKAGKDNSARLIREKIKRFFLKQRKPTRIVRGRNSSSRGRGKVEGNLLGTLIEAGGQALKQASRITGEVIERATTLNRAALETGAEWMEGISPTAAELVRPDTSGSVTVGPPPQRPVELVTHETLKPAAPPAKSTRKAKAKAAVKATKTKTTRAAKDSRSRAEKKGGAKKAATKSTANKRSRKAGKKTSKKKSGGKSQR